MCRNRFRTSEKLLSTGFRKITHLGVISAVFLGTVSLVTPRLRICKRDAHIWFGTCAEIGSTVRELLGTVFRKITHLGVISAVFLGTVSLVTPRLRICKRDAHIWFGTCAEIGSTVRELLGTVFRKITHLGVISAVFLGTISLVTPRLRICKR